ncbi:laccase domain-containing protein [Helicobacter muridarum]|uniref:Laccase domain protein yfiH n=1 Tax=Helicobacter muridarum TaxID=216 RepID=A0A377PTW9_9HELI|nr:polyphenol oxidase family protein [Helicobacter muridarum]TLD97937.1 laccase domain-containing protein [Helicobacter muridarum]STQ85741.1 Laccase domain protein yfiH [Helicobacter muridarum]
MNINTFYSSKNSELFQNDSIHFILTNRALNQYKANYSAAISENPSTKKPLYNNLNLAYHVGDVKTNVTKNRQAIMQAYYPNKTLLYLNQIHSSNIIQVKPSEIANVDEILLGNADGIICDSKDFVCLIMVADCNPILLYCPIRNVFALLHAGRLGVTQKILTHSIKILNEQYGVLQKDIKVFIGASIRECCYEIGLDIARQISLNFGEKYLLQGRESNSNPRLNMIAMLYDEMFECGILLQNIEIFPICSCCNKEYFSYRRDGITGRFGLLACLK